MILLDAFIPPLEALYDGCFIKTISTLVEDTSGESSLKALLRHLE